MTQFAYLDQAWPALMEHPERLAARLTDVLETKLGGRLVTLAFCFGLGEFDGMLIFEAPDDSTATAILVAAVASSRHVKKSKTTKLLTAEEFANALRSAQAASAGAPGAAPTTADPRG